MKRLTEYIAEAINIDYRQDVRMMGFDRVTAVNGPMDVVVADYVEGKGTSDILALDFGREGYIFVLREEKNRKVKFSFVYSKKYDPDADWNDWGDMTYEISEKDLKDMPGYQLHKVIYDYIRDNQDNIKKKSLRP